MGFERFEARCRCDACGKPFVIEIEPSISLTNKADMEAIAREAVFNGTSGYTCIIRGKGTLDRSYLDYDVTIQGGMLLCDICSLKCDEMLGGDNLTKAQVEQALGLISQ